MEAPQNRKHPRVELKGWWRWHGGWVWTHYIKLQRAGFVAGEPGRQGRWSKSRLVIFYVLMLHTFFQDATNLYVFATNTIARWCDDSWRLQFFWDNLHTWLDFFLGFSFLKICCNWCGFDAYSYHFCCGGVFKMMWCFLYSFIPM